MLDVFEGEWSSRFPPPFEGLRAGAIPLFEDSRIHWMIEELGGISNFRVLELGPLEAGHSYMLDRAGVATVLAVEANRRAFLKCLMVKEILGMPKVQFCLGDFREMLAASGDRWDLCVASGVLYHMQEPVELLKRISDHTDRLFLWTHYYDEAVVLQDPNLKHRFGKRIVRQTGDFSYTLQQFNYLDALDVKGFCGGSAACSHWLTRDGILDALRHVGFQKLSIAHEMPGHVHGPCFSVLATR